MTGSPSQTSSPSRPCQTLSGNGLHQPERPRFGPCYFGNPLNAPRRFKYLSTLPKQSVPPADLREGFRREHDAWASLFARPAAEKLIRGGLEVGAQTKEGERDLEGLLRNLKARVGLETT